MTIGRRIAELRDAAGLSQGQLAERIGKAQTTISSWERGRTEPTREDARRVAAALGVGLAQVEDIEAELDSLEGADGLQAQGSVGRRLARTVPVVGYVGAGAAAHLFSEGQGPFDYVAAPDDAGPSTVAAEIRGESAGPWFNGWLIFYDDVRSPVTTDLIGEVCVVGLTDGRILMKEIQASRAHGLYHLLSQFEPPILDVEVAWAAKVTSMRAR